MKNNEYKCGSCGGVFEKAWTDEEANQEAKEIWGVDNASQRYDYNVVCDDCFKSMGL